MWPRSDERHPSALSRLGLVCSTRVIEMYKRRFVDSFIGSAAGIRIHQTMDILAGSFVYASLPAARPTLGVRSRAQALRSEMNVALPTVHEGKANAEMSNLGEGRS